MRDPSGYLSALSARVLHAAMVLSLVGALDVGLAFADQPAATPVQVWPVQVRVLERTTEAGPIRGLIATINLADPRVDVVVTSALGSPVQGQPNAESVLVPTDQWAREQGVELAINANYFARLGGKKINDEGDGLAKDAADIIGVSVSDGRVVSEPRQHEGACDPALIITKQHTARVERLCSVGADVLEAVAGVGASATDPKRGSLLVENGKNLGETARVDPNLRHPRTAAGVSADGRTLVLVVIDGRQKDFSVGMTLPELADVLIENGAANAVNLDGGGSSALVYRSTPGSEFQMNRPSDGHVRAVANHLGVRVRPAGGATTQAEGRGKK